METKCCQNCMGVVAKTEPDGSEKFFCPTKGLPEGEENFENPAPTEPDDVCDGWDNDGQQ